MKGQKKHKHGASFAAAWVFCGLQLLVSVLFILVVKNSKLLPAKYLLILVAAAAVLEAVTVLLATRRHKGRIVGIILSILVMAGFIVGCVTVKAVSQSMQDISGTVYKTDNMIVAVRKGDTARSISDAKDYSFAVQTAIDTDNNQKMIENVEATLGQSLQITEFASLQEEVQALVDGKVDAAIYNASMEGLIEENMEDYEEQVRVLYEYGVIAEIPKTEPVQLEPTDAFNLYISGIDTSGDVSNTSRSDVNIIATVNPGTHQILLTTTPRDYFVEIPGISGGQRDKLTHAGIYGIDASIRTLEALYDTDISYFLRVNFTSVVEIVDLLGGVDVENDQEFSTKKYTFKAGTIHLNGAEALAFSRERHAFSDGDNQRGKNQEKVIEAILKKMMQPEMLLNAGTLFKTASPYIQTDMTFAGMTSLISSQLATGEAWSVESRASTGSDGRETPFSMPGFSAYVMWPDEDSVAENAQRIKEVLEGNE